MSFNGFKGTLAENYACSALTSDGYTPFYWESQGKAEVDFVIQNQEGHIIPVEVKSSDNVKAKSLAQFVGRYQPPYSIRLSGKYMLEREYLMKKFSLRKLKKLTKHQN